MRTWSWKLVEPKGKIGAAFAEFQTPDNTIFYMPIWDDADADRARFIVDALNAAEYDDGTRRKGKALIDSLQAIIDEKQSILDEIDAKLAEAVRRTNG